MRTVCWSLALLPLVGRAPAADTWPGFRGDGSGVSPAARVPVEWSPKTLAWTATLPGYGQSCPVVWKDKVFVTSIDGPKKEKNIVSAFALDTGKQLWSVTLRSSAPQKDDRRTHLHDSVAATS